MLDTLQHAPLIIGVLDLLHFDDLRLLQHLHGVEPIVMSRLHQMHPSEAARAQRPLQDKVVQRVLAFRLPHLRLLLVPQLLLGLGESLLMQRLVVSLRRSDRIVHGACTGTSIDIHFRILRLRRLLRRVGVMSGSSGSGSGGGRLMRGVLRGRGTHMVLRGNCAAAFIRGGLGFVVASILVGLILLLGMVVVILWRGNGRRRRMVLTRAGRVGFSLSQQSPKVRHGESSERVEGPGVSDFLRSLKGGHPTTG